jgi:hypothetical protein
MLVKPSKFINIVLFILATMLPLLRLQIEYWFVVIIMMPFGYLLAGNGLYNFGVINEKQVIHITNDWLFWYSRYFKFSDVKYVEINTPVRGGGGFPFVRIHIKKYLFWGYYQYVMFFSKKDFLKIIQYLEDVGVKVDNKVDFSKWK